ncbi:MAG: hypothetical protein Q8J69_05795 [Sphingobacteriaceae bacterium]|nr:hypothetical protein [Sphingobacteriaceae bacterium]
MHPTADSKNIMKTLARLFSILLLVIILFTACNKEEVKCSDSAEFCAFIGAEEYDKTGVLIDKYLSGLQKDQSDQEKLNKLKAWLACKSCVESVEISDALVLTNPPKSSLLVSFNVSGLQTEKSLFILMDEPLSFGHYSEPNN